MKNRLAVATIVICQAFHLVTAQEPRDLGKRMTAQFEPFLKQQMQEHAVPGFSIGVVKDGAVIYAKAFGVNNLDTRTSLTTRSLFHQASLTKPFVATCIMQLAEKAKIGLDDPVIRHLPYFKLNDERYKTITIRQIVTHTAGMPDVQDYEWDNPVYDEGALERYVRRLHNEKLIAAPGTTYRYSNMAFEVLGDLIAKVSGMSFETYVHQNILAPLKMQHSTLLKLGADPTLLTAPHVREGDSVVVSKVYPYNRMHAPSSTLISSTVDMCRWALANLNRGELEGRRILKAETYDLMWQAGTDVTDGIGLSWKIGRRGHYQTVFHGGRDTGYRSFIMLVPAESLGIVAATNYDRTPIDPIMDAALTIGLGEVFVPHNKRRAIALDPEILKDYVGVYEISPQVMLNISLDQGKLFTQVGARPKNELCPESEAGFFLKIADVRVVFERNDRGRVLQAVIRQGASDMIAKKVK